MWYDNIWNDIDEFLHKLEEPIDSDSVFNFLSDVEKNIRCKKCKIHFYNFKKPEQFYNKNDIIKWFEELKLDIKKQKNDKEKLKKILGRKINNRVKKNPVKIFKKNNLRLNDIK